MLEIKLGIVFMKENFKIKLLAVTLSLLIGLAGVCGSESDKASDQTKNRLQEKAKYIESHKSNIRIQTSGKYSANTPRIRRAIYKYKTKNYTGCVQDLEEILKFEPYNSVVWYYLGLSYSMLGNKDNSTLSFNTAKLLDPNSLIGKYSQRGLDCLANPDKCVVKNESQAQIDQFINSHKFVSETAKKEMLKQRLQYQKDAINHNIKNLPKEEKKNPNVSSNSEPTNEEIAQAVRTFQKLGLNPFAVNGNVNNQATQQNMAQAYINNNELAHLNMMLSQGNGMGNQNNGNNMMNMLPLILSMNNNQGTQNTNGFKVTPEMIQIMMTSAMMPGLDFGMKSN